MAKAENLPENPDSADTLAQRLLARLRAEEAISLENRRALLASNGGFRAGEVNFGMSGCGEAAGEGNEAQSDVAVVSDSEGARGRESQTAAEAADVELTRQDVGAEVKKVRVLMVLKTFVEGDDERPEDTFSQFSFADEIKDPEVAKIVIDELERGAESDGIVILARKIAFLRSFPGYKLEGTSDAPNVWRASKLHRLLVRAICMHYLRRLC